MSVIVRQRLSHSPTNVLHITIPDHTTSYVVLCLNNYSLVELFNLCLMIKHYNTDFTGSIYVDAFNCIPSFGWNI